MGYDYEMILDEVDKLSLQGRIEEAKELVRELVPPLFAVDFTNLMELIERNTYKLWKSVKKNSLFKNTHIITLELIHDMLEVKQHINNYQRNTNKKYGLNLEKDEVINREVADMIIINTLGKLNMLAEQSYFLRLVRNTEVNSPKIRKAEKFAKKPILLIKSLKVLILSFIVVQFLLMKKRYSTLLKTKMSKILNTLVAKDAKTGSLIVLNGC